MRWNWKSYRVGILDGVPSAESPAVTKSAGGKSGSSGAGPLADNGVVGVFTSAAVTSASRMSGALLKRGGRGCDEGGARGAPSGGGLRIIDGFMSSEGAIEGVGGWDTGPGDMDLVMIWGADATGVVDSGSADG